MGHQHSAALLLLRCLEIPSIIFLYQIQLIIIQRCSQTDSWQLKIHVLLVYLLDTALQIVTLHTVYIIFVTNFSDLINLLHLNRFVWFHCKFSTVKLTQVILLFCECVQD